MVGRSIRVVVCFHTGMEGGHAANPARGVALSADGEPEDLVLVPSNVGDAIPAVVLGRGTKR